MPGWEASPHAEVIAGADLSNEALSKWSKTYDIAKTYSNSADIINDPDIDIIDICTPNMYHTELTIAALEAGKHVICEKPLAPTPEDVDKMIAARDASGKMLMTAQHFRFSGKSKAMKSEIDNGALGDIYHARSWMLRRIAIPTWGGFLYQKHSGGGAAIDIGVHILDLTLWFMGNPKPVSVTGVAKKVLAKNPKQFSKWGTDPVPQDMDVDEVALAFVRFENDATLVLEVSWLLHHDTDGEDMQMWLYGTGGGAHWPKVEILQSNYDTQQMYNYQLKRTDDLAEPHAQECIEFAQAIVDGAPSPVPAEQSRQVMQILNAVYESQKTGREVRLD
jgi:predicted dehydrogenase